MLELAEAREEQMGEANEQKKGEIHLTGGRRPQTQAECSVHTQRSGRERFCTGLEVITPGTVARMKGSEVERSETPKDPFVLITADVCIDRGD